MIFGVVRRGAGTVSVMLVDVSANDIGALKAGRRHHRGADNERCKRERSGEVPHRVL